MLAYALQRLAASIVLIFLVLTSTFFLLHLAPGDPVHMLDLVRVSAETRTHMLELYGLDKPIHEQYVRWLKAAVTGDWGISFTNNQSAWDLLMGRAPATFLLVISAVVIEHILGLWIGLTAALHRDSAFDVHSRWISLLLHSLPSFVLAIFAIEIFAARLGLFPSQHMTSDGFHAMTRWQQTLDLLHHLALPALTLGVVRCGAVARFVRNGMLDILSQDYVRTARALGVSERRILWLHALPNCLGPLVQRLGSSLPILLSGVVILEIIFAWPGLGITVYDALLERDYPVVLVSTAFSAFLVVAGNLMADLLHGWIDPRVREAHE